MRALVVLVLGLILSAGECLAAKKDFKGLFGSYRRDKFTENEANPSDFGIDVMLSTMLPLTPIVSSREKDTDPVVPMQYSTFFNGEIGAHFSLGYNWLLFANVGYYTYSTRKDSVEIKKQFNSGSGPVKTPLFHLFDMTLIPMVGGIKYRFSRQDIVPYLGVGGGISRITRNAGYDYDGRNKDSMTFNAVTLQAIAGVEFYVATRTGIRLEVAGTYLQIPGGSYHAGGYKYAHFIYGANPIGLRYASGLFILF